MYAEKQNLPIVFIHIDDSEYLKYTLAQARISNPFAVIHLIGDLFNDNYDFVEHHNIKNYSSEAELFSKLYKHHSTNSYDGELFCFRRWFVLKEFMEYKNIQQCLYLDSDVLLFADIQQEDLKYRDCAFTLSFGCGQGFNIIHDAGILNEFCDFIVKCFISQSFYNGLVKTSDRKFHKCLSDMVVFYEYQKKTTYKIGDISLIVDKTKHDANINLSEGFETEGGVKKVRWTDGTPYCREISSDSFIRFNSLHFQGKSKHLIKEHFKGTLYLSEDSNKWSVKNMNADMPLLSNHSPGCTASTERHQILEKIDIPVDSPSAMDIKKFELLASSNIDEALEAVEEVIEQYPLSPELLALYGDLKWKENDREATKRILSYVSGRWPDYLKALTDLEVFTSGEDKWAYASKLIQNASILNAPVETTNLINRGFVLLPEDSKTVILLIQKIDNLIEEHDFETARDVLDDILFELAYLRIREPKRKGYPVFLADSVDKIAHNLLKSGLTIDDYPVDVGDYQKYFQSAQYKEKYSNNYPHNLTEKSLEHYIAAKLLEINEKDVYIDIAAKDSPVAEIFRKLFGAETFRQDISYTSGFKGNLIGGDAANMPVPDHFANKVGLYGSFEHFEGDSDIVLIREATKVLKPGGSACIIPLSLAQEYSIVTDPVIAVSQNVAFEDKAVVCCVKGFNNRFGRFYDPDTLKSRIQSNLGGVSLKIFKITNANFDPSCYVQFAALLTKPD
jgi:hypothetical protein